jgi:DNA polymerase-1
MPSKPQVESGALLPEPGAESVLYLVDISGYVFRAFYALPPLTSERGEPTGALYGVTTMLLKLVRERRPHMLAVVMDGKGPSFRRDLYTEYKSNRPSAPDDLKQQMGRVREVADAYAIPCYERDGVEADDLIATLVKKARQAGRPVVIVSADKDLLQLVGEGVWMLDTMKQRAFGPAETVEKLGVTPEQVRDYLALVGDSSDNVPGVPSVGPKTAVELLTQYGTLDGIYEHLPELKKKALKAKLEEHKALAYLSRDLVSLKDDYELELDETKLIYGGWDDAALRTFVKHYGFVRLIEQLGPGPLVAGQGGASAEAAPLQLSLGEASAPGGTANPAASGSLPAVSHAAPKEPAPPELSLRVIERAEELSAVAEAIERAGSCALFAATEGDEPVAGALVGLALSWGEEGVYIPLGHAYLGCPPQIANDALKHALAKVLENPGIPKRSSSAKRDTIALAHHGIALAGVSFDCMLASYLLDPDLRGHGLQQIYLRKYDLEIPGHEGLVGKGKVKRQLSELSAEEVLPWAAREVNLVAVGASLAAELDKAQETNVLTQVELPLAEVLADMERRGVMCDANRLRELSRTVDKEIQAYEKKCFELVGKEFNVNSPRQLETILFDDLKLPVVEKTKTGRSTNADVLEELAILHPLPAAILEHRSLAKLKGTYLDALPREINPRTGRIHTKFEQAVAATGRLSSNEPNLQNIPIRTEIGRSIRTAFVAAPGFRIFAADYSQIELRVLAHLSDDPALTEAFANDDDVHVLTASALFGVDREHVSRDQRAAAKTVNFAVIYGQTQFALARNLRIARGEAQRYIKAFFERYAGVRRYLDTLVVEARATGSVRTLMGRRRLVRDITAKNHAVRSGAERIAQNTPIQGSAADIMKTAMVRVHAALAQAGMRSRMVLTVHDELVFEAAEGEHEALEKLVREAMEGAVQLKVPLVVGSGWGESWGEAH